MPQEGLQHAKVHAAVEEMACKGVAKHVRRQPLRIDAGAGASPFKSVRISGA